MGKSRLKDVYNCFSSVTKTPCPCSVMFFLIFRSNEFLPLPDSIKTLYSSGKKHEDNPEVHEGRIRSFEHLEGNWATHIGVSCKGHR